MRKETIKKKQVIFGGNCQRRQPVKSHSNNIVSSELLEDCISKATICSKCKNSKSSLQLWQQDSKRTGLCDSLF